MIIKVNQEGLEAIKILMDTTLKVGGYKILEEINKINKALKLIEGEEDGTTR